MPILAGTPLALPQYANVPGAYADVLSFDRKPNATDIGSTIGGAFVVVPVTCFCIFVPSAAPGTRNPFLEVLDPDGHSVFVVPGAAGIGASTTTSVSWLPSVSSPSTLAVFQLASLPAVQLLSGYVIHMGLNSPQAGDTIQQAQIVAAHFPTNATPAQAAPVAPAAV